MCQSDLCLFVTNGPLNVQKQKLHLKKMLPMISVEKQKDIYPYLFGDSIAASSCSFSSDSILLCSCLPSISMYFLTAVGPLVPCALLKLWIEEHFIRSVAF